MTVHFYAAVYNAFAGVTTLCFTEFRNGPCITPMDDLKTSIT